MLFESHMLVETPCSGAEARPWRPGQRPGGGGCGPPPPAQRPGLPHQPLGVHPAPRFWTLRFPEEIDGHYSANDMSDAKGYAEFQVPRPAAAAIVRHLDLVAVAERPR